MGNFWSTNTVWRCFECHIAGLKQVDGKAATAAEVRSGRAEGGASYLFALIGWPMTANADLLCGKWLPGAG